MGQKPQKGPASSYIDPLAIDAHKSPVLYIDRIVAAGFGPAPGAINLDLGAIEPRRSPTDRPQATIQCKLRMTISTAQNIVRSLGVAIAAAQAPDAERSMN